MLHGKHFLLSLCLFIIWPNVSAQTVNELLLHGEYEQASKKGLEELKQHPNNTKLLFETGLACKKSNDYKLAASLLKQAATTDTTNYQIMNQLADTYDALGFWTKAVKYYEKSLTLAPENPTALKNIAKIHYREEKYLAACNEYSALERLYPKKSLYTRMLGICRLKLGDGINSYVILQKAYQKDTLDVKSIVTLANLQLRGGLNDRALNILNSALTVYPNHPKINYLAGRAHFNKNHHYRARPHWEKLLSLGDSSYNVLQFAGRSYHHTFQHRKAIELMELAYDIDSTFLPVLQTLAKAHEKLNNHERALHYTQLEGKLIYPSEQEAWRYQERLADRYKAAEHYQEAIACYKKIPSIFKKKQMKEYCTERMYISVARCYDEGLKDKRKAVEYYQKYLDTQKVVAQFNEHTVNEVKFRINFLKEELHFE